MDVQIVDGWPKGNEIRMLLTNTDAAQVNAIRRALIADVPKLAIDRVNFDQGTHQDNKGQVLESVNVLPDEVIAHRLAMIPVPTYPDEGITFPDDCPTCKDMAEESKGCMTCQVLYHIRKEGPSEDSDEAFKTVYAEDLTTISDQMFDIREEHKRIPLTILSKGQYSNSMHLQHLVAVETTLSGLQLQQLDSANTRLQRLTNQRRQRSCSISDSKLQMESQLMPSLSLIHI